LTHGYQTAKKKISSSSIYFESMPYQVDNSTGYIDYDTLEKNVKLFRPQLIICGASAYPREYDYARLRKIADVNGSYLMADIAHFSGLVAAQELLDPFQFCDVVTTTTHKTLRGPRAGLIFFRKIKDQKPTDLEARVNFAVFPSTQGGPHNNTIAAVATALKQAATPEFKAYAIQIKKNSTALADTLKSKGYKLVTDGSDNHLILWDLRPLGLTGNKVEKLCEHASISLNKNAVHGDTSALSPGGVRVGVAALTSRNFREQDFKQVGEFLHQAVQISLKIQEKVGKQSKIAEFEAVLGTDADIKQLKEHVEAFARKFPMPGFDVTGL
jgi:glycine hydroxymethyltransferase